MKAVPAVFLLFFLPACQALAETKECRFCVEATGWPPFSYEDPKQKGRFIGASVELVEEILGRAGCKPVKEALPWNRCLAQAESGKSAMVLDASWSEERAAKFFYTKAVYTITSALFHTRKRFPAKPLIATAEDMNKFTYCGILGYNYSMYRIDKERIDSGSVSEPARLAKLRSGRCDFLIGDMEILKGFEILKQVDLSDLESIPIPGAKPKEFFVLVSRQHPESQNILKIINEGIIRLKEDGTYDKIFARHGLGSKIKSRQ